MIVAIISMLHPVRGACSSNAIRDIYLSDAWKLVNSSSTSNPSQYQWANSHLSSKVTTFTTQTPASDNWCVTEGALKGATQMCCSTANINSIAIQFLSKYIFGILTSLSSVTNASSLMGHVNFQESCKLVSNPDSSKVTDAKASANRSINGMYYGVAKWIAAFAPLAQSETCLICANDATIATYFPSGALKIKTSEYSSLVTSIASALLSFNNAQNEFNQVLNNQLKWYFIDNATSLSNCTTVIERVNAQHLFCTTQANCEEFVRGYINNTALQYEAFLTKVSPLYNQRLSTRRLLRSRLLATAAADSGYVELSTYTGITSQVKIEGQTLDQLKKSFGQVLQAIAVLAFIYL